MDMLQVQLKQSTDLILSIIEDLNQQYLGKRVITHTKIEGFVSLIYFNSYENKLCVRIRTIDEETGYEDGGLVSVPFQNLRLLEDD